MIPGLKFSAAQSDKVQGQQLTIKASKESLADQLSLHTSSNELSPEDIFDQVVALPKKNLAADQVSQNVDSTEQTFAHQTNSIPHHLQTHCRLSDLLQVPSVGYGLRYHQSQTSLHPVVPLFTDPKVWCPCLHQAVLCPFHHDLVLLGTLFPQAVRPEAVSRVGTQYLTARPLYLGFAFHGFPEFPPQFFVFLRQNLATDFQATFRNRSTDLNLRSFHVVAGAFDTVTPFVAVIITPKSNGPLSTQVIDDAINQIGFVLLGIVSSNYKMFGVTMTCAMLPQRKGFDEPQLRYPWYLSRDNLQARQIHRILCAVKQSVSSKDLKGRPAQIKKQINTITSLNHLEQTVTQQLGQIPPFKLEGYDEVFGLLDKEFQCVFVYDNRLHNTITCLDEATTRQLQKYANSWKESVFSHQLLQTRYNFPVSLYDPSNQVDSFQQIVEQLSMCDVMPQQARTVTQFLQQVRGDMFTEFQSGFNKSCSGVAALKYYEKRKVNAKIAKYEKLMTQLQNVNCIVPDDMQNEHQKLLQQVGQVKTTDGLSEQQKRCLASLFELQVMPSFQLEAYTLLQQNLEHHNLVDLDPKLPRNMLYSSFMDLIRKKFLPCQSKIKIFDTVLLSHEAELSFLMTANYISQELLRPLSRDAGGSAAVYRDHANLLLFGESGTGKSFTLEALSTVLDTHNISALCLSQMFKGSMTFAERSLVNASCMVTHEVKIQDLFNPGAKEYLDVSLSKRKINIKYQEPISMTRGVPFFMGTNDFIGDTRGFFELTRQIFPITESQQIKLQLGSDATPVFRRVTAIPFFDQSGQWLKVKKFNDDFNFVDSSSTDSNSQYLPYALALLGAAFMLNGRATQYLTTKEDCVDYARFMAWFEVTHIGQKIKRFNDPQFVLFNQLYKKYCLVTNENADIYHSRITMVNSFKKDAEDFAAQMPKFKEIKDEFQSEYKRLHCKFVAQDSGQRFFNPGFSDRTYRAVLYKILVIAQFQLYRLVRHHGLTCSTPYMSIVQFMEKKHPSIPSQIVFDNNLEGKRKFVPGTRVSFDLKQPVMQYFSATVVEEQEDRLSDFDSVSTVSFIMNSFARQQSSVLYSQVQTPSCLQKRRAKKLKINRPTDKFGLEPHIASRDPGAQTKRRQNKFSAIRDKPQQVPVYQYNSDDETYKAKLKNKFDCEPLFMREVPFCTNCQLVRASVKQTKVTRRKLCQPVTRMTHKDE